MFDRVVSRMKHRPSLSQFKTLNEHTSKINMPHYELPRVFQKARMEDFPWRKAENFDSLNLRQNNGCADTLVRPQVGGRT